MRRAIALIVFGLGVSGLVFAALLPTYVYSTVAKVPLTQSARAVLTGTADRALVVGEQGVRIRQDIPITATSWVNARFVLAPEMRPGSDVAVWVQATKVRADSDGKLISASVRQVCFDRRTAKGVPAEPESSCGPKSSFVIKRPSGEPVRVYRSQRGLNFKYPFDTEKRSYRFHDTTLGEPVTSSFLGVAELRGISVYKFVRDVPPTKMGTEDVPGELFGMDADTVEANRFYSNTVTAWVDPVTGIRLKVTQQPRQELRVARENRSDRVVSVFDATLSYNAQTISDNVRAVEKNRAGLVFLSTRGPLIFGIAGGILLITGSLLLIVHRRRGQA